MLTEIIENIINFLLPRHCLKCGRILSEDGYLCNNCVEKINFITAPYCRKCGQPLYSENSASTNLCGGCLGHKKHFYRLARSAMVYDDSSKSLITAFKFADHTENATLLAAMLKVAGNDIFQSGIDVIIPVPLHYTRLLKRHYNQSALLARKLAQIINLPVDVSSLVRHRKTRPQTEFSGRERVTNVKDAFSVKNTSAVYGKRVLLIDDVMTTGSTLKESARALKKAGVKSVDVLTVARVVD